MTMRNVRSSTASFFLSLMAGIALALLIPTLPNPLYSPLDGGPLDYRPRLEASGKSPDGALTVKVFRQRNPLYSIYVGAKMYVRIYDKDGSLLHEKLIGEDGAWDELDHAYKNIEFDGDLIRVSNYWGRDYVVRRADLKRINITCSQ
jgi:hypothetical protein